MGILSKAGFNFELDDVNFSTLCNRDGDGVSRRSTMMKSFSMTFGGCGNHFFMVPIVRIWPIRVGPLSP